MKSICKLPFTGASLVLCIALNTNSYCQKKPERSYSIPEDVNSIFKPFCYSCHGPDGGRLPHSKLNFTIWNGYTPGKQVEKAALICSSMQKGTMPTKLWKQQNPEARLTAEQISIVCRWSEAVRLESEKSSHRKPGSRNPLFKKNEK